MENQTATERYMQLVLYTPMEVERAVLFIADDLLQCEALLHHVLTCISFKCPAKAIWN